MASPHCNNYIIIAPVISLDYAVNNYSLSARIIVHPISLDSYIAS